MDTANGIPLRILGRTGLSVTVLAVGGYHIGKDRNDRLGIRIIRTAIDEGVNFLDNAWCYNEGVSESIMGLALEDGYRDKVVLMTKNHGRDGRTFRSQLEDSLHRLKTDTIDVLQFHEIIKDEFPEAIYNHGPLEEAIKARDEGKIRYIGFTGHWRPYLFKRMLEMGYEWDTVQMPVNLLDYHYESFAREIIPMLTRKNIGVIGMKSLAGDGGILTTGVSAAQAMSYSLSQPIHTLVSGMDTVEILGKNLDIVRSFEPLSDDEQKKLLAVIAPHAGNGELEGYKK